MANICIVNHDVKTVVRGKRNIYTWLRTVAAKENKHIESLTIILCSDEFLLDMNRSHLNHDYYTDVITFDLSDTPSLITGEIYISIDRVKDNSATLNLSWIQELHRVMVHGLLHLCGYEDKTKAEKIRMRKIEDKYLKELFQK